jgi:hypothetical protein
VDSAKTLSVAIWNRDSHNCYRLKYHEWAVAIRVQSFVICHGYSHHHRWHSKGKCWLIVTATLDSVFSPTEFVDSVTHVRVLSWVLLGALQSTWTACLPIPIESSQHIADYIHFVLAGFAERSKVIVVWLLPFDVYYRNRSFTCRHYFMHFICVNFGQFIANRQHGHIQKKIWEYKHYQMCSTFGRV